MSDLFNLVAAWPSADLFSLPPFGGPAALTPGNAPTSIMRPFNIPDALFQGALDAKVPLTIAATYAITAKLLNGFNKSRNKQPWSISKTRAFHVFVVLHNVFLAVYSAWTFWGMLTGLQRTLKSPFGPGGAAATADSICRIHGAPGLGNSVFFNDNTKTWQTTAPDASVVLMDGNGLPSSQQMGRMWAEGLGYYGWIFYLSKFYEVLDTFIILAKGKYSSTLQTYHHAGAMLCMWAGIRYMSCPIFIFVLVNSFIHALMYTYYTLTAFSIKVPMGVKRTLTTMQITQFIGGASAAMVHSFVYYYVPTATSSAGNPKASPAAAGSRNRSSTSGDAATALQPCITTRGETFAIWLNVFYLAPLTYLFVSFFISSYVKRSNAANKINGKARRLSNVHVAMAEKAGWDAARSVEREVYGGEQMVSGTSTPVTSEAPAKASPTRTRRA